MHSNEQNPSSEEPETVQSGDPDGKVLHLNEDDNDFILDILDVVIERLSALETAVQRVDDRLAALALNWERPL
jgi:hypothetical protein